MRDFERNSQKDIYFRAGKNILRLVAFTNPDKFKTLYALYGGRMVSLSVAQRHIKRLGGFIRG